MDEPRQIEQELQQVRDQMTRLEYSDDSCYTNGRMHRLKVLEHQLQEQIKKELNQS